MSDDAPPERKLGGPGFALVETARDIIAAEGLLTGGETVVVGVSGGPDSVCLLDVLARLSGSLELNLVIAHVDHGLSAGSAEVAAAVSGAAAAAGFDVHLMRIQDLEGPNLHARARSLRYGFFDTVAGRVGATRIATAHTLDDRVETTLARLVHGAGTDALAGIRPLDGARIRPLIGCRRRETRAYCDELGLEYHDDPANEDERFERPAVRRRLVGAIEEHWGEGAIRAIATSARRLGEDAQALAVFADKLYERVASDDGNRVVLSRSIDAAARGLVRRLLERAVGEVRDRSGGIEAVLDALEDGVGGSRRFAVASGVEIEVNAEEIIVRRSHSQETD